MKRKPDDFPRLSLVDACEQLVRLDDDMRRAIAANPTLADALSLVEDCDGMAEVMSLFIHTRAKRWQKLKQAVPALPKK